jgi:hypothetical protein
MPGNAPPPAVACCSGCVPQPTSLYWIGMTPHCGSRDVGGDEGNMLNTQVPGGGEAAESATGSAPPHAAKVVWVAG